MLEKQTLILNADYRPLSYYPLSTNSMKKVIKSLLKGKIRTIEEYDETINIGGTTIHLPKTAVLKKYTYTHQAPKFNRYNVFLRDKFTCQYCGKQCLYNELTFDHIVPKMKGGKTTWDNIITACKKCNLEKGCKDIDGKQFRLLSNPHTPTNIELMRNLKQMQMDVDIQTKNWEQWLSNI